MQWRNASKGTKCFALTMHDPDASTGSCFWHWTAYNIPAHTDGMAQSAGNARETLPAPAFGGSNDVQDAGVTGANGNCGGRCPPEGDKPHRYVCTVYALAVDNIQAAAGVPRTGTAALYGFVLNKGLGANMLGKASFTATYGR